MSIFRHGYFAVIKLCTKRLKYKTTPFAFNLGPSINGNTKLCCRGFILALFQSTTANKIDSEHTQAYKRLLPICEAEILRVIVKRIEVFSSFYVDF